MASPCLRTRCATEDELRRARGRLLIQIEGRYIALVEHNSELFAMDATCYHMGGPLLHADIEDMGEFGPAIVCPWHRYQISLRTGDGLYVNMAKQTCSKGARQRTHAVEREGGDIFVTLDAQESKVESDTYAFKTPAPSGGMQHQPPHGRSGQVLRAGAAGLRAQPCGSSACSVGPQDASVASDVAKSMFGADGRAPWARGLSSSGGTPAVAKGGSLLGLHLPQLPVFGGRLAAPPALDGWVKAVVAASRPAGRATVQLSVRGALPGSDPSIWARGAHLMLALVPGGAERPYTPFVLADKPGQFELLVKAYDGGELSAALAALRPGAELRLKGPLSGSTGVRADAEEIGLVAGGTGITPMLQLLLPLVQRAQASGTPTPRVHVLCFNRTEEDILLHEQLQQFCATSARVHVEHCLTNPPKGWAGIAGRPTASLLAHALTMKPGPQVQLFYCGPPSFNSAVRDALGELGFTDEMVHEFS